MVHDGWGRLMAALAGRGEIVEALKGAGYPDGGTVEERLTENIATIGENMSLRRAATTGPTPLPRPRPPGGGGASLSPDRAKEGPPG